MAVRIISFLLWIIVGISFFIYDEIVKKKMFINETNIINENVIQNLEKKKQENYTKQIEVEKAFLLKSLWNQTKPVDKKLIIYDNMLSFENLYKSVLSNTWFFEKSKRSDFIISIEYINLEKLKKELLKSKIIFGWNNTDIVLWIPKSISCDMFKIKSPCYHYESNGNSDIVFNNNEVFIIRGNKEYSQEEALKIIDWTKPLDL